MYVTNVMHSLIRVGTIKPDFLCYQKHLDQLVCDNLTELVPIPTTLGNYIITTHSTNDDNYTTMRVCRSVTGIIWLIFKEICYIWNCHILIGVWCYKDIQKWMVDIWNVLRYIWAPFTAKCNMLCGCKFLVDGKSTLIKTHTIKDMLRCHLIEWEKPFCQVLWHTYIYQERVTEHI